MTKIPTGPLTTIRVSVLQGLIQYINKLEQRLNQDRNPRTISRRTPEAMLDELKANAEVLGFRLVPTISPYTADLDRLRQEVAQEADALDCVLVPKAEYETWKTFLAHYQSEGMLKTDKPNPTE